MDINSISKIDTGMGTYLNKLDRLARGVSPNSDSKDDKALLKACQDFEQIFLHMLLKEMRSTIPDSGLAEKSTAREMFEDMYDQELATSMSKNNGIGIAKMLYNQMKTR